MTGDRERRRDRAWLAKKSARLAWRPWGWTVGRRFRLERPIFVIGTRWSGVTPLAELLGAHPDVAYWGKGNTVWYPRFYAEPVDFPGQDVHGPFGSLAPTAAERRRIRGMFGFYAHVLGKRRFLSETPENAMRLDRVKAVFPDCVFVHVRRDGRAVTSARRQKVGVRLREGRYPNPPRNDDECMRAVSEAWVVVTRHIEESARRLGAGEFCEITYEALCEDVHGALRQTLRFCDLDPDRYDWARTPRRLENRNHEWRQTLSPREQAIMLDTIGARLRELGYDDSGAGAAGGPATG